MNYFLFCLSNYPFYYQECSYIDEKTHSYTQLFEKKKNFKPHMYYCKPMKNDTNSRKANGNLGLLLTEKADDILSSFEKDIYNSQLKYRMIFVYKLFDLIFHLQITTLLLPNFRNVLQMCILQ